MPFLIIAVFQVKNIRCEMVVVDGMLGIKQDVDWLRGCRLSYIHKHSGWWR